MPKSRSVSNFTAPSARRAKKGTGPFIKWTSPFYAAFMQLQLEKATGQSPGTKRRLCLKEDSRLDFGHVKLRAFDRVGAALQTCDEPALYERSQSPVVLRDFACVDPSTDANFVWR